MRVELQNEEHCRYLRVYHYYRNLILSGQMKSETKLPSIRKGASELQMSRTTMENNTFGVSHLVMAMFAENTGLKEILSSMQKDVGYIMEWFDTHREMYIHN